MQSLKIIITLLVLIVLGILVGSNLLPMMSVIILSQPTVTLPIGVWLTISIGLGLFSSSSIQLLLFLERRRSHRKIRQLQQRLQEQDEDVFYTVPESELPKESSEKPDSPNSKKQLFNSYRFPFRDSTPKTDRDRFTKPSPDRISVDDDDWETEVGVNSPREWDDELPPPRQQVSNNFASSQERESQNVDRYPESIRRKEVYDAEFRLIQPPYKEPDLDELDDEEIESDFESDRIDNKYADFDRNTVEPISKRNYDRSSLDDTQAASDLEEDDDDENWGFDFDDREPPLKNSQPRDRKFYSIFDKKS